MLKNILLIFGLLLTIAACSVETKSEDVVPPSINEKSQAGPYTVDFNNSNNNYQHNFKMNIDQNEGKVEYFITTSDAVEIEFVGTSLKVTGCSASQVTHQTYWIPDGKTTTGQYVIPGSTFKTQAATRGTFTHILRDLSGCTLLDLTTTLRKKQTSSMKCKESSDSNCHVAIYCKEKDPLKSFIEVEVWEESWGTTLREFRNQGNGTRNLMTMNSVTFSNNGTESTYISKSVSDKTFLKYNNQNLLGLYSQAIQGTQVNTDVTCEKLWRARISQALPLRDS
jgi:hypothetical protein